MPKCPQAGAAKQAALVAALVLCASTVASADQASENYRVRWDVADAGGGSMMSVGYVLADSLGQTAIGETFSASYIAAAGFQTPPDTDGDLLRDFVDNCTLVANLDQRDSNDDGYGNLCDADLNDDGVVNFADLGILKAVFFTADPDADLNGDSSVNFADLGIVKQRFFTAPGPSGLVP